MTTIRKIFFLITLFLLSSGGLSAQNWFVDEDFSSGILPVGWTEEKDVSSSAVWSYTGGVATFDGGNRSGSSAVLITDAVDLSKSIMPSFSFSYSNRHVRGMVDSLVISYRTATNSSWKKLFVSDEIQSKLTDVSIELKESQQENGFQLKFEAWNRYGGDITIDNVMVKNAIACSTPPTEFRIFSLNDSSVSFMWNPGVYADSSRIILSTEEIKDFDSLNEESIVYDEIQANSSFVNKVDILELTKETHYYAYLQVSCGSGDVSPFVSLDFITPCPLIEVVGAYFEDFEENADCWLLMSNSITPPTIVSTHAAGESQKSLYFYTAEDKNSYAILPIDATLSELQLSFSVFTNEVQSDKMSSKLNISVVDNPANLSNIPALKTVIPTEVNAWQNVIFTFSEYAGTGKYLVLYTGEAEKENKIWIDNFAFEAVKSCYPPQLIKFNNIKPYSVDLSWDEIGNAQSWYLKVSNEAIAAEDLDALSESSLLQVNSLPYTLGNLESDSLYYVYVRSDCGEWNYKPIEFRTAHTVYAGYSQEFVKVDISEDGIYYGNLLDTARVGNWVEYPYNSALPYPSQTTFNNIDNLSEGGAYKIYASNKQEYRNVSFVIFPELHKDWEINNIQLSLYAYIEDISEPVIISVCEGFDISTAVVVDTLDPLSSKDWEEYIVTFENYSGAGRNITISSSLNEIVTSDLEVYIDDINVEPLNRCNPVTGLRVSDVLASEATLSWYSPGAPASSTWSVDLYTENLNDNPEAVPDTSFVASSTKYKVNGLVVGTTYYARVNLNSTDCETTEYSNLVNFTTQYILEIPYFNDFADNTIGENMGGLTGWYCYNPTSTYSSNIPSVYDNTWSVTSGSVPLDATSPFLCLYSSNYYPNNYAVMPLAHTSIDMSNLTIQFYALGYGQYNDHNMVVGIMDDPRDPSTFTPIDSIELEQYATVYNCKVKTDSYTGTGRYLAFKGYSSGKSLSFYLDNLYVYETTDCDMVSNISVSTTSLSSIEASWTSGANETSWDVKLIKTPVTFNMVDDVAIEDIVIDTNVTTNPIILSNLNIDYNTDYYIAVRSKTDNCTSMWVVSEFNTGCDYSFIDLPYEEDFNNYGIGVGTSPDCWYLKPYGQYYEANLNRANDSPDYENGIVSGAALYLEGNYSPGYSYAIMPAVENVRFTTLQFQLYSNTADSYVEVGVMESVDETFKDQSVYYSSVPANDKLFTLIDRIEKSNGANAWEEVTVDFSSYTGKGSRIAFRIGGHGTPYYSRSVAIDSLILDRTPDCSKILLTTLEGITPHTATVDCGKLNEKQWGIMVATSELDFTVADDDSGIVNNIADVLDSTVTDMPFTLTELADNTTYYVYLRREQTGDDSCVGEWSDAFEFTTTCAPISDNFSDDFESNTITGKGNAVRCWQIMGDAEVLPYPVTHSLAFTGKESTDENKVCYAFENSSATKSGVAELKTAYAILPELSVDSIEQVQITFKAYTASNTTGQFQIGVVTDPSSYAEFNNTFVTMYSDQIPSGEWTEYRINFADYISDDFGYKGKYIVIQAMPSVGDAGELTSNLFYIDDFTITPYSATGCEVPFRLKTDTVGESMVKLSWDANVVPEYQVIITDKPVLDTELAIVDTIVNSNPATIEGLPVNSRLYAYVRSKCADDTYTDWSRVVTFHTVGCNANILPYTEGFEYAEEDRGALENCWDFYYYNSDADPDVYKFSNYKVVTGDYSLELPSGQLAVMPMSGVDELIMKVDMITTATDYYAQAGVARIVDDSLIFIPLQDLRATKQSQPFSFEVRYCDYDTVLSSDKIAILTIAEKNGFSHQVYLDNIYIDRSDALWAPTYLEVISSTEDAVNLTWHLPGENVESIEVAVMTTDQTIADAVIQTVSVAPFDSAIVSGLSSSTSYIAQVRASLDGKYSAWSTAVPFSTTQVPDRIPYSINWEESALNSSWSFNSYGPSSSPEPVTYWTVGNATSNDGDNSLYITYDGTAYNYTAGITYSWAHRTIEITEPGVYEVSAMAKCPTYTYYDYMSIAFVSAEYSEYDQATLINPATNKSISFDVSTGDHLVVGRAYNVSSWTRYNKQIEVTEPGYYNIVIFNYIGNQDYECTGAAAVDEITVKKYVLPPSDVTVTDITAEEALVTWAIGEDVDSCEVTVSSDNFNETYITRGTVNEFNLTNLTESTNYKVSVVAYVEELSSSPVSVDFITNALPVSNYPYINNFDNESENIAWVFDTDETANKWTVGADTYYNDDKSLYITYNNSYSYGYGLTDAWAYREFEFDAAGVYKVSMMAKCPSQDQEDYLSVSLIPGDFVIDTNNKTYENPSSGVVYDMSSTSFEANPYLVINRIYATDNSWAEYSRLVVVPEAGVYKLAALYYTNMYSYYGKYPAAIDSVSISEVTCTDPLNVYLESVGESTASISWSAGNGVTQYSVIVSTEDVDNVTDDSSFSNTVLNTTVNDARVDITALNSSTTYYIYVKSLCDDANGYVKYQFTTVNTPVTLPYIETFATYELDSLPTYWNLGNGDSKVSNVVNDPAISESDSTLYMAANTLVVLPNITSNVSALEISFDAVAVASGTQITVGVVSSPYNADSFEALATFDVSKYTSSSSAISDYILYRFAEYDGTSQYIALRSTGVVYVDDILVDNITSCDMPLDLTTTYLGDYSASIGWTNATDATSTRVVVTTVEAYDISVLQAESIILDTLFVNGEQNLDIVTEPFTTYYAYANSACGDATTHSIMHSFTTAKVGMMLPFYEPISVTNINGFKDNGWENLMGSNSFSTSKLSGDTILNLYSNPYLQFPDINVKYETRNLGVDFEAVAFNAYNSVQLIVGVFETRSNISSFVGIDTVMLPPSPNPFAMTKFSVKLDSYTGSSRYVGFSSPGGDFWIDDITLYEITACTAPMNLSISDIGEFSAALSFDPIEGQTEWRVIVARDVCTPAQLDTMTTATASFIQDVTVASDVKISGLLSNTNYYLYVRGNCDDAPEWSSPLNFTTGKDKQKLPYYLPIDVNEKSQLEASNVSILAGEIYFNTLKVSGDTILEIYDNPYVELPEISELYDMNDLGVDFDAMASYSGIEQLVVVGVLETSGDITTFVPVDTVIIPKASSTTEMQKLRASLENYKGTSSNICIFVADGGDIYIDDIYIYEVSPCMSPVDLRVTNVTGLTADLSFDPVAGQSQWRVIVTNKECTSKELNLMEASDAAFMQDVTDNSFVDLTGLEGLTEYYVYVKGIGDCTDIESWSEPAIFTTLYGAVSMPYFEDFTNVGLDSLPEGWLRSNTISESEKLGFMDISYPLYKDFAVASRYGIESSPVLYTAMNANDSTSVYRWAVGPEVIIDGDGYLSFDLTIKPSVKYSEPSAIRESEIRVYISSDYGKTWTQEAVIGDYESDDYQINDYFESTGRIMIDMLPYVNDTIKFAFYISNEEEVNLEVSIDDVSVSCFGERTFTDIVSDGYDYTSNGFDIFYKDLVAGTELSLKRYVPSTDHNVCDSLLHLNLKVLENVVVNITGEICSEGDVYDENGFTENYTGLYLNADVAASGADSLTYLTLTLRELNPITYITDYVCEGSEYLFGDIVYTEAGVYRDTLADVNGCDSIVELTLSVSQIVTTELPNQYICEGESFKFGENILTESDTYFDTLTAVNGCDSILSLTLTVIGSDTTYVVDSICSDESYEFGDSVLTTSGVYIRTVSTETGCEGVEKLTLTVLESSTEYREVTICDGSVYEFAGENLTVAGEYKEVYTSVNGCDSTIILTLSVYAPETTELETQYICAGNSYKFADKILTESGTYYDTLTTVNYGCDSIVYFTLTVIDDEVIKETYTMCEGEVYEFDGQNLTESGVYTRVVKTDGDCEGKIELTLTVVPQDTTYTEETITLDDLPYSYGDLEYDENTEVGEYVDTISTNDDYGCINIEIYTLTVIEGEVAVDNARILDLSMYPNPLSSGATLYIDAEFTEAERDGMVIEVMNTVGQLIVREKPATDEITINGLTESGVYIVRITTGTGIQYLGKVIVK